MNSERKQMNPTNGIYTIFKENLYLVELKETLDDLFIKYDRALNKILAYRKDIDSIEDDVAKLETENKLKDAMLEISSVLENISITFEKLNYTNSVSAPTEVDENNLIVQLKQYSGQANILSSNFQKDAFTAFANQTYYLATLVEFYCKENYDEVTKNEGMSEETEETIEKASEVLEEVPDPETNELS